MESNGKTVVENLSNYLRKSVTLKLVTVFVLILMLMIPVSIIISLIGERESLRQSAIEEVSDKWSKEQLVYGPVLTIPVNRETEEEGRLKFIREEVHILPSVLNIDGEAEPQILSRGIYKVVVYNSTISLRGKFSGIQEYVNEESGRNVLWNESFLTIHISDLRGINETVTVNWNDKELPVEPGTNIPDLVHSGLTVNNIFLNQPTGGSHEFSFKLNLQGSQHLGFVPLGKETNIHLTSDWQHPGFSGSFLPDERSVTENGFTANYKILELNRNYPQSWTGLQNSESIRESAFGVDLLLPVNDYQKAMRSAKYALLVISLTFLTFFLVEVFNKKSVHPFQYILIGLALVLFYTLLISLSEHTSFVFAYIISSISVIVMIGLYARAILGDLKQTLVLVSVLTLNYAFIYFTLQVQDYALLLGSVLLTLILAFTMYITRNINWYELGSSETA